MLTSRPDPSLASFSIFFENAIERAEANSGTLGHLAAKLEEFTTITTVPRTTGEGNRNSVEHWVVS